jgi:hypothetical protein
MITKDNKYCAIFESLQMIIFTAILKYATTSSTKTLILEFDNFKKLKDDQILEGKSETPKQQEKDKYIRMQTNLKCSYSN